LKRPAKPEHGLTLYGKMLIPIPSGSENIEIILKDESRIQGRVIDEDTGQGVPG